MAMMEHSFLVVLLEMSQFLCGLANLWKMGWRANALTSGFQANSSAFSRLWSLLELRVLQPNRVKIDPLHRVHWVGGLWPQVPLGHVGAIIFSTGWDVLPPLY